MIQKSLLKANRGHILIQSLVLCVTLLLLSGPAHGYEHKRNTPSVGGQGLFGYLEGDSDWRDTFSEAMGLNFSLRMNYDRDKAYGVTFEQHHYNRIRGLDEDEGKNYLGEADDLEFQIMLIDFYKYFNRPQRRCYYLIGSAGFYRPQLLYKFTDSVGFTDSQASFPGINGMARVGVGVEYFLKRKVSIDVRLSGYYFHGSKKKEHDPKPSNPGVFIETASESGLTVAGQASIGIHLYVTQ